MPQFCGKILHSNQLPAYPMNVKPKNQSNLQNQVKSSSKLNSYTSDQNNSNLNIQKKSRISNIYLNYDESTVSNRKKSKNSLLVCKSVSKKLFSKAKIIQNPLKQTYLSPQSHRSPKMPNNCLNVESKRYQQNGFSRLTKARSEKNLLVNSPYQLTISSPRNITKTSINSQKDSIKKNRSFKSQQQVKLEIDNEQINELTKNNLFTSVNGIKMLQSLQKNLKDISQINLNREKQTEKKLVSDKKQLNQKNLINKFLNVSKVQSIQIEHSQQKSYQQKQVPENMREKITEQNMLGSISRLILGSQFVRRLSKQVQLSDLIEQESIK